MNVFVTGTDTDIGKTFVSSWLIAHTGADYFKPLQTGLSDDISDSNRISALFGDDIYVHKELAVFPESGAPYYAAQKKHTNIIVDELLLPTRKTSKHLIVEGAGGLMVPITKDFFMIDLIKKWNLPVILVSSPKLGTINHTQLSLEALKHRNIPCLGMIMHGKDREESRLFFEKEIIGYVPWIDDISLKSLRFIEFPTRLQHLFSHDQV